MRNIFIIISILLITIQVSNQTLQVISPIDIKSTINKIKGNSNGEIESIFGRFGEIPYGKSITGYAFSYYPYNEDINDWCDSSKFVHISSNMDYQDSPLPIVLANSLNCSFTVKAKNVQAAKGSALIIYSSTDDFEYSKNYDDNDGQSITIPTILIKRDSGKILFDALSSDTSKKIMLSLSFKDIINEGNNVNMQIYLRSDQVKALHFFKEFESYALKLGNKLNFTPVYKYTECTFCDSKDNLEELPEDSCFRDGKYCGSLNLDLNITNSRLILLENLRQKCIYEKFDLKKYWNYMIKFSEVCANINLPTFNKKCSLEVMKLVNIDNFEVESCMKNELANKSDENSLMAKDYELYNKYSVHRYPQIIINNFKYKDIWLASSVMDFICERYISPSDTICTSSYDIVEDDDDISYGTIFLLVFTILFSMIIVAYCYRRIVNKAIDQSIEDRIFKQTQDSVGNYSRMDRSVINTDN